jgi:hypothetical protein
LSNLAGQIRCAESGAVSSICGAVTADTRRFCEVSCGLGLLFNGNMGNYLYADSPSIYLSYLEYAVRVLLFCLDFTIDSCSSYSFVAAADLAPLNPHCAISGEL